MKISIMLKKNYNEVDMSKTALCIRMLNILYSKNVVSVRDLASMLETNKRNILEYKKELECAGYYIESVTGKYGGYKLDKSDVFPVLTFTPVEEKGVDEAYSYLMGRKDFMFKEALQKAMGKISASSTKHFTTDKITTVLNRYPFIMSQEQIALRYNVLYKCIQYHKVISINYLSSDGVKRKIFIHPYKLYMYNNAWFVLGYCETTEKVEYYKLNRIQEYVVSDKDFTVMASYNERDYLGDFGTRKKGEWHEIRIHLIGKGAVYAQERYFGREQQIEMLDDDSIILTCKMQDKCKILQFVLGMGTDVEVISPSWLKKDVYDYCQRTMEKYANMTKVHLVNNKSNK